MGSISHLTQRDRFALTVVWAIEYFWLLALLSLVTLTSFSLFPLLFRCSRKTARAIRAQWFYHKTNEPCWTGYPSPAVPSPPSAHTPPTSGPCPCSPSNAPLCSPSADQPRQPSYLSSSSTCSPRHAQHPFLTPQQEGWGSNPVSAGHCATRSCPCPRAWQEVTPR